MACKGSGVQIPSAPPQVRGPLHRRPPANPGLAQQIRSNRQCAADALVQGGVTRVTIAGVLQPGGEGVPQVMGPTRVEMGEVSPGRLDRGLLDPSQIGGR
jgi:hypothetical protein